MRNKGGVWFARGREIADFFRRHPQARQEIDFDAATGHSTSIPSKHS
jgi:hypothetical protein